MTKLDVSSYLLDISPDSRCGEDLEYDPIFQEMVRLAEGTPERQVGDSIKPAEEPEWKEVLKRSQQLLERTRDIQASIYLARAAVHIHGLEGVRQGLALIHGLLNRFWECVYPLQDPEDKYPVLRMNLLATLNDFDSYINPIRNIPLTASRVFQITLRDIEIATGKSRAPSNSEEPLNEAQIQAALLDSPVEELHLALDQVSAALNEVREIVKLTTDRVGSLNAPDLSRLDGLLAELKDVLESHLRSRVDDPETSPVVLETKNSEGLAEKIEGDKPVTGENMSASINDRGDVARAIDRICDYFDTHEPSSPVPLLLRRAQRLLTKDFIEILQDLAPDGVGQAENVCGSDKDDQN
ncbi:MAG TPA: type VI secretion system protein TssA [Gammaproteobacteria bacterium]|nr:type VI secretion system protein TssA [Gammaproteobacteria bacterium]